MADLNQLYAALLKADAAGDVEGAKTLAQYIQQVQGVGAPPPEAPQEDGFFDMAGRALVRGAKQTGSLLGDVLPAMVGKAVGAEDYAARQMAEAEETQKEIEAKYGARYKELSDVKGLGDVLPFVAETVLEQVPNIATAVVPGAGGAAIGARMAAGQLGKTAVARGATTEAAERYAQRYGAEAAAKGAAYGGGAGAFLGSYALNAPEVFQNIFEETGQMEVGASVLAGSVAAALDSILPAYLVRQFTPGMKMGVVEKVLEKSGMAPGIARGATAGALTGIATEGPTEAAQEAISIAAEKFVQENPEVWGSKEFNRLVEAGVRGAVGGGGISGIAGGVKGFAEREPKPSEQRQVDKGGSALDQIDKGEVEGEGLPDTFTDESGEFSALQQINTGEPRKKTPAAPPANLEQIQEIKGKIGSLTAAIRDLEASGADETVLSEWYAEREKLQAQERALRRGEESTTLRAGSVEQPASTQPRIAEASNKSGFIGYLPSPIKGEEPLAGVHLANITPESPLYERFYEDFPQFAKGQVDNMLFMNSFDVPKNRNKGYGRQLLKSVLDWADNNNKTIFLVPSAQFDSSLGGLTQTQLKDWYSRNGFIDYADFMLRPPQAQSTTLRASGAREEALRMAGMSEEEIQRRREAMGEPNKTYPATTYDQSLSLDDIRGAGLSVNEAEAVVNQAAKGRTSGSVRYTLNNILEGKFKFADGWRVPTDQDYADANEETRAKFDRLKEIAQLAPQQRLLAQQMGLDLIPATEETTREFLSPIAMSEREFELTAPEGQVSGEVDIETPTGPPAAPLNLVSEQNINQLEAMLNSLQPTAEAEQGTKNYRSAILNFLNDIRDYLKTDPAKRKENLNTINAFFNTLGLTSDPALASRLAKDLKGKTAEQQNDIIRQRTKFPKINTLRGINELRQKFSDFMEQQSIAALGEFPGSAASSTFASDVLIPKPVATLIRQLRNRTAKSLTPEERAFMAYMGRFRYGLAMKSAAYDLANNIPSGTVFTGQGTKEAKLFQKFVEENFPANTFNAFNSVVDEYKYKSRIISQKLKRLAEAKKRREEYLRQKKAERKEVKQFLAEDEEKKRAQEKADIGLKYAKEIRAIEEASMPSTVFNANSPAALAKPLHPAVEERIANGDVDGALELIEKFPNARYWQLLARRLRAANLTVTTRFGEQERLVRFDLANIAPTVNVLVSNIRDVYPDVYNKHLAPAIDKFTGEIDPTLFAKGLKDIKDGKLLGDNFVQSSQINWVLERYTDAAKSLTAPGFYMFSKQVDVINLNKDRGGDSYYALFHELIHAATAHAIRNPSKLNPAQQQALANLEELYAHTLSNHPSVSEYGLQSLDEFIAEAFSNAEFQSLLASLPYKNTTTSIWSKVIEYIRKLMGGKDTVLFGTLANADILMTATEVRGPNTNAYSGTLMGGAIPVRRTTYGTYRTAPDMENNRRWLDILKNRPTWEQAKNGVSQMIENVADTTRQYYLGAFTLRQLQDLIGGRLGGSAKNFINAVENMLEDRNAILDEINTIHKQWGTLQSKDPKENEDMSLLMTDSTLAGFDPDGKEDLLKQPYDSLSNQGKDNYELVKRWVDLSDEAKNIYRKVRNFYKARFNDYKNSILKNIELEMMANDADFYSTDPTKVKAAYVKLKKAKDALIKEFNDNSIEPYFPLKRFGKYSFYIKRGMVNGKQAESEFYLFDSAGARNEFARQRRAEMQRAGDDRVTDTKNTLEEFKTANFEDLRMMESLNKLVDAAGGSTQSELRNSIKDSIEQLYFLTLPSKSVRKLFINRKQISGSSQDMIRAFADSAFHMAYQQARFKHSRDMFTQLDAAKAVRETKPDGQEKKIDSDYIAELEKRLKYVMNPTDTGTIPSILSNVSFIWYLTAPASALVNMLGVPAIGYPVLATRFGKIKAAAALTSYGKKFMAAGFKDADGNWTMPSLGKTALTPQEKAAYDLFVRSGLIDITQSHDLAGVGEAPSNLYTGRMNAIMKGFSAMFHHAERFNREVMAMSAFRMAYDSFSADVKDAKGNIIKAGDPPFVAFNKAVDQAKDLTYRSMFDYSTLNKPRFLQNAYSKVILQFKQFPQHMTYLLTRSGYEWVDNLSDDQIQQIRENINAERVQYGQAPLSGAELDKATKEQIKLIREEGRGRLLGTLGMTFLFAGAAGMPLFSVGSAVIEAVHAAFSDEDEPPLDFENWFKNWMATTFGDFWGDSISRGLFTQATGVNIADRMSLNDLWFRDARKSQDEVTAFQNMIINLLGPTAALGVSGAEAVKLYNDGYYYRAAERALPAIFKQPMVAMRYDTEGVLTLKGDQLVSNISGKDALAQSLGFAPEKVAQRQKSNIEMKTMEQDIIAKRQDLMNAFFMGFDSNDAEFIDKVLNKITKFNQMYPTYPITGEGINRSIQTRYRNRALASITGGIPINKNLMFELRDMGYYGNET